MQWDMWMSRVLHHTLPLGVTVALHHIYLVTKNGFVELLPVPRQAHSLEVQEEEQRPGGSSCIHATLARQTLNSTCLGG